MDRETAPPDPSFDETRRTSRIVPDPSAQKTLSKALTGIGGFDDRLSEGSRPDDHR